MASEMSLLFISKLFVELEMIHTGEKRFKSIFYDLLRVQKKMSKKLVTQDVKEKNLMPVTCVANSVLQDHINIHTGENHECQEIWMYNLW